MYDTTAPCIGLLRRGFFAVLLALAGIAGAHAADAELGRYLATECMTCHRSATATSTIPNIFGLSEAHLNEVMRAYRAKVLPNPVMQNVTSRLSDEDIGALAAYFATAQKPK